MLLTHLPATKLELFIQVHKFISHPVINLWPGLDHGVWQGFGLWCHGVMWWHFLVSFHCIFHKSVVSSDLFEKSFLFAFICILTPFLNSANLIIFICINMLQLLLFFPRSLTCNLCKSLSKTVCIKCVIHRLYTEFIPQVASYVLLTDKFSEPIY